jgi:predicted Zn-ribbon and HTH transcriptional regulator
MFLEPPDPSDTELLPAECYECGHHTWVSADLSGTGPLCPKCSGELVPEAAGAVPELIQVTCPVCGHQSHGPKHWLYTLVQCPKCLIEFILQRAEAKTEEPAPAEPTAVSESVAAETQPELAVAECAECGHRHEVAVEFMGMSAHCPKCLSDVVLEPAVLEPARRERRRKKPDRVVVPVTVSVSQPAPAAPAIIRPCHTPASHLEPDDDEPPSAWRNPISAVAVLLLGIGLTCSSIANLCVLVMPLCGVAVLVAVAAGARALRSHRPWAIALGACAISAAVFLTVALSPATLGKTYRAYRDRGRGQGDWAIRVAPLPGQGEGRITYDPESADASRVALLHGPLRVQVVSATIEPVELRNPSGRPIPTKENYLVLRLRTHRTQTGDEYAAGIRGEKTIGLDRSKLTLTDNTGKVYVEPALDLEATRPSDPRGAAGFPLTVFDTVAVFEPPAAGVESLRLEISTTASGGTRALRFTIPKTMIRTDSDRGDRRQ